MPYREKKIYSGDYLEVEIYPITLEEKKAPRKKKEKMTAPKQRNLNDKNSKKHLIRLVNTNFSDDDLALHLTYENKYLPKSEEDARKDVNNLLRRIKYHRKKKGLEDLKYIAVIEYKEQKENQKAVRIHHHLVISGGIDRDIVENLWIKGRANADRLKADEYGYEGLARYITKDPKGNRRWTQSKNLKQPTVRVNDNKYSKRKVEKISKAPEDNTLFEKVYKGFVFNECKAVVNDYTGSTSLYIKMRRLRN